jgi:glycosyltransferase involved in cell wall biosynthesis
VSFVFVVPDVTAMISGGNVYNAALVSALRAAGADVSVRTLVEAEAVRQDRPGADWLVDSLYLEALPRLCGRGRRTLLLAHYLPSLVEVGAVPAPAALSAGERAALAAADGAVVPSQFMADALAQLGLAAESIVMVAPGIEVPPPPELPPRRRELHAIVVANLVPGKRVLPLVRALAQELRDGLPLRLTVVGSLSMDRDYADACRETIVADPLLAQAITLAGPVAHDRLLGLMAASDVLLSPSCMESFGLALAEARALGLPIIARAGGNSAAHVEARAGGVLVHSDGELATACARLGRDGEERRRRLVAARAARPAARGWSEAARDFLQRLE